MDKTSTFNEGDRHEVEVVALTSEGVGLARAGAFVIFVEKACPGDHLLVEITEKKKKFARGRIEKIIQASPHRTVPRCQFFEQCGGCSWQHVDYPTQLEEKSKILLQALRNSGLKHLSEKTEPIVGSPETYEYRNRIQLHGSANGWGYRVRKGHEIVPIDKCAIANPRISEEIPKLSTPLGSDQEASLGTVQIALTEGGGIEIQQRGEDSHAFSQVNTGVNELLQTQLYQLFDKNDLCLDLYAGNGNLSLELARRFSHIEFQLIELNALSCQRAREKAPANCKVICSDVEKQLHHYFNLQNSTVIVDPPRAGLSPKVAELLIETRPAQILYVSCDPQTLARDLSKFQSSGFEISSLQPFDMFPQTPHLETLVNMRFSG